MCLDLKRTKKSIRSKEGCIECRITKDSIGIRLADIDYLETHNPKPAGMLKLISMKNKNKDKGIKHDSEKRIQTGSGNLS